MADSCPGMELLAPTASEVIFKYRWTIRKYSRAISKQHSLDSPQFDFNINGLQTRWNMSIRFWKGPEGKHLTNPVVLCLNLTHCAIQEPEQAKIRFQFGVYNSEINQWEVCHVSRVILQLQDTKDILSVGYRDLSILERHMEQPSGDVHIFVKVQLIETEKERNSLSQDLRRLMGSGDVVLESEDNKQIPVHACILRARSKVLDTMLGESQRVKVEGVDGEVLKEVVRFLYTDKVDNLDTHASTLLAVADRLRILGLKELCERTLMETITPESVASLLLLADQFECDNLKRTALAYCEDNASSINKSLAWRVMELVNPDLFDEVREAGLGSSISSNLDSIGSDFELAEMCEEVTTRSRQGSFSLRK